LEVKEKRGRKRYILFEHPEDLDQKKAYAFLKDILDKFKSKIKWKIIRYESKLGILLVDHKISLEVRQTLAKEDGIIKTKKTSGTIKSLIGKLE